MSLECGFPHPSSLGAERHPGRNSQDPQGMSTLGRAQSPGGGSVTKGWRETGLTEPAWGLAAAAGE